MAYTHKKLPFGDNIFEVTTEVNGVEKKYNLVVANDESELDGLVAFAIEDEKRRQSPPEVVITYTQKRRAEYPSFEDQFDLLYNGGYDVWKSTIQAVKDKYPKP